MPDRRDGVTFTPTLGNRRLFAEAMGGRREPSDPLHPMISVGMETIYVSSRAFPLSEAVLSYRLLLLTLNHADFRHGYTSCLRLFH